MKTIGRDIMWNLQPSAAVIMWALFGCVLLVMAWGFWSRIEAYRRGARSGRTGSTTCRPGWRTSSAWPCSSSGSSTKSSAASSTSRSTRRSSC